MLLLQIEQLNRIYFQKRFNQFTRLPLLYMQARQKHTREPEKQHLHVPTSLRRYSTHIMK